MNKIEINGHEYEVGVDVGEGDVSVVEFFIPPATEYPMGSYMQVIDGKVMVATGYYATLHPGKPSLHWHGGPPFFILDTSDWPWELGSRKIIGKKD